MELCRTWNWIPVPEDNSFPENLINSCSIKNNKWLWILSNVIWTFLIGSFIELYISLQYSLGILKTLSFMISHYFQTFFFNFFKTLHNSSFIVKLPKLFLPLIPLRNFVLSVEFQIFAKIYFREKFHIFSRNRYELNFTEK